MRPPYAAALALALASSSLHADTISIQPSDDTAIMEGFEDDFNFGGQRDAPIGTTGAGNSFALTRGLFRFDIAAAVPAGSTINSGSFDLTVERAPDGVPASSTFELHRMLVPWIEGDKNDAQRPGGRAADAGEPTWNHRASPATTWGTSDTPGGEQGVDFSAAISASEMILSTVRTYTWILNTTGVADLQDMLDTPATNYGWMLLTASESTPKSARRFYMKETLTDLPFRQGPPPELIVDFTPPAALVPPDVTVFSYDGSDVALEFVAMAGLSYAVQTGTTLADDGWTTIETFDPIANGPISTTVVNTAPVRSFVRISVSDD